MGLASSSKPMPNSNSHAHKQFYTGYTDKYSTQNQKSANHYNNCYYLEKQLHYITQELEQTKAKYEKANFALFRKNQDLNDIEKYLEEIEKMIDSLCQ